MSYARSSSLVAFGFLAVCASAFSAEPITWPDGAKVAVSLSYDDALDSQLDNAAPALGNHNFRGSFYLVVSSDPIRKRLDEWRALAALGHEMGNHTVYHRCSGSSPNRDWIKPHNDLDFRTVEEMKDEVVTANVFLHALDGQTLRTFTPPCNDLHASGENYLPAIETEFIAIKGQDNGMQEGTNLLWVPEGVSGWDLIAYVEEHTRDGMLLNIVFHGIGDDYLTVSSEAHEELLQFLDENRDTYWVDTYLNIMMHAKPQLPTEP